MDTIINNTENYRKYQHNDLIYWIGKHAKGNTYIVTAAQQQSMKKSYLWFHDDIESSAHLIVELDPDRLLSFEEKLYFASKINKSTKVCITNVNNIKTTKILGQVVIIKRHSVEIITIK
jgi:hypothetical protein